MGKRLLLIMFCFFSSLLSVQGSTGNPPSENDISCHYTLYDENPYTYRAAASCSTATKFEWMTMSPGWTIKNAESASAQTMHDVLIIPDSESAPTTILAVRACNNYGCSDWVILGYVSLE